MIIYSLPLSKLELIDKELNASFLQTVLKDIPQLGKEAAGHFLINNNIQIINQLNLKHIHTFNAFLQLSRNKGQVTQLIKDGEEKTN